MSHYRSSITRRTALAIAVHVALFAGTVHSAEAPAPKPFPAYRDGHVVPAAFDDPNATGNVHHDSDRLDADVSAAVTAYCATQPTADRGGCELNGYAEREIDGGSGKESAYSVIDIKVRLLDTSGRPVEEITRGGITLVRACPTDALLVDDRGVFLENQAIASGTRAVACASPDDFPKSASLGVPTESGANQCPIGNSPTVGNPINPLTMTKIETAVDYAGPASSGLVFGRTYQSGAFSLNSGMSTVAVRYPVGARIGARWRHSFDRQFVRRPYYDDAGRIYATALHLIREDGNETRFVRKGDGFVPAEGERGSLREDPAGGWVYTQPDLTVEHYDGQGRFRDRTDPNGNRLALDYAEITVGIGLKATVLTRVSDRQGRELVLSYDRLGRLETVDTPDGRLNYSYSGDLLEGLDADLVRVGYPDGRTVSYVYDEPAMGGTPNHKLTGIIGSDGKRFATFGYDKKNRAISSSHAGDAKPTELEVGVDGAKVYVTTSGDERETWTPAYANGVIRLGMRQERVRGNYVQRQFDYQSSGLVDRQTDYLGVPTKYQYDAGRQLEVERKEAWGTPVARTVRTTWHPVFDKPVRIDDGAQWTTLEYDTDANLIERRDGGLADAADPSGAPWPDERVTRFTYDGAGRMVTVDGPLAGPADTVRYAYRSDDAPGCTALSCAWRKGDLHTVTDPLGHVTTVLAYDASGRLIASTDANGVRTDRRYDPMGRVLSVVVRAHADGSESAEDIATRMTYTVNGDIDTVTDPDGGTIAHRYNEGHLLVEQTDSLGHTRQIIPDAEGRIGEETFTRRNGTKDLVRKYSYDTHGLPTEIIESGIETNFSYDANGRFLKRDGAIITPTLHRDARGRVDRIIEGKGTVNARTDLAYDGADRVRTMTDPNGLSTAYLRNGIGDLLWQRSPDTGDTSFENDANGRPTHEAPADTRSVERVYDVAGRTTKVTYSDGAQTTLSYDAPAAMCPLDAQFSVGRLSSVVDKDSVTEVCYDFAGRVVLKSQTTRGVRLVLTYEYTRAGRLAAMTYPDGRRVSYTRDAMGRVTAIDMKASGSPVAPMIADVRHDSLGRVVRWTAGTRNVQRVYSGSGEVKRVRDDMPGGLTLDLTNFGGDVQAIDNEEAYTRTVADDASRITMVGIGYRPPYGFFSKLHTYSYDKTGNRLTWGTEAIKRTFEYAPGTNYLMVANKVAREYDAAGNTTRMGDREFVYDASGRMSQAKVNGIVEMNYAYNALGQQVSRYIAGQTVVALHDEAGHWIGDYDGAGNPIRQVVWLGDLPLTVLDGDAIRDIQTDHVGTPRVVIDRTTGKAIWNWSIHRDAFGSDAPDEDPDRDGKKYTFDMRFPGQRYDAVTGLFQNGWRDYDPTSGRYIQSDPIGLAGGISTYAYVGSNPYVRIDPQGLDDTAAMYNREFWGRPQPSHPDYYHLSFSYVIGSASLTLARSGRLHIGFGPVYGGPKSNVNVKGLGVSFASGLLGGCDHTPENVDNFVGGAATGASAYYMLGGGISYNSSGHALETGFGTPGATYQVYENNVPVIETGLSW